MELNENEIKKYLSGSLGKDLVLYETIDSTNNAAKLLAKNGAPHGSVVLSRQQTAGKGRLGRSFFSPPGAGIYLSIILRPKTSPQETLLLTAAASVAVFFKLAFIHAPAFRYHLFYLLQINPFYIPLHSNPLIF